MAYLDRYDLPMTTPSQTAAAQFALGMDTFLRLEADAVRAFESAVVEDPSFALAGAWAEFLGGKASQAVAKTSVENHASSASHREQSHIAALQAVRSGSSDALDSLLSHLSAYPRDALLVGMAYRAVTMSGRVTAPDEVDHLLDRLRPSYGGDWYFLGVRAMQSQERRRFAEAADLADEALGVEPRAGQAVHARTHVFYETNHHAVGREWLDGWLASCSREAPIFGHFSWHAALHDLATGKIQRVQERYQRDIHTAARESRDRDGTIIDGASLVWRCVLAGEPYEPSALEPLLGTERVEATALVASHFALVLAVIGDVPALRQLATRCSLDGRAVFREVVAPVVDALAAFVEERFALAARLLEPPLGNLIRIGGTNAQRDVFHETLLHAHLRAGEPENAQQLLAARLNSAGSIGDNTQVRRLLALSGAG